MSESQSIVEEREKTRFWREKNPFQRDSIPMHNHALGMEPAVRPRQERMNATGRRQESLAIIVVVVSVRLCCCLAIATVIAIVKVRLFVKRQR